MEYFRFATIVIVIGSAKIQISEEVDMTLTLDAFGASLWHMSVLGGHVGRLH